MRIEPTLSIFARMTALAQEENALNLAQGLMWLPLDPLLLEYTATLASDSAQQQYTSPAGLLSLRETVARLSLHFFQTSYDPEREITITAGATEGLFCAIQALSTVGDEVFIIEPAYDSYRPACQIGGLTPRVLRLDIEPEGIKFPWIALQEQLNPRTRLLLLNFPHNPTGYVLHEQDVRMLEEIVESFPNLYLLVDEAYELLCWEGERRSVRMSELLRSRSVIIGSLGKMMGTTGWRLGHILAPPHLTERIRTVHQFITFCAPSPFQAVAAHYLAEPQRALYFHSMLLERRQLCIDLLQRHTGLEVIPPEGGYFVLVRPPHSQLSDTALAEKLTKEIKVAMIPLSPFYSESYESKWLRLCFARPTEMIREAVARLSQVYPADQSIVHPSE
ncbi:MAG: aminotransferase class I/II-fold pyridoxal phosphate-dependent enzyme [Bacteroidia bacterium]|nr:aminotransferase class I/II-fold pyridoxal phosphate-dependent enzyme [Bacteroidia bacterium]